MGDSSPTTLMGFLMARIDSKTVGRFSLVAGIVATVGQLALLGFFGGGEVLGVIGDFIGVVTAIIFIPLFICIGHLTKVHNPTNGRLIQFFGVLAALLKGISALLIGTGIQSFAQAVIWEHIGSTLLGMVVIVYVISNRSPLDLGRKYFWFSIIFGSVLLISLLGFVFDDQFTQLIEGRISLSEINPLLVILLFTATPITILGYPIWLFWTARLFLNQQQATADWQIE